MATTHLSQIESKLYREITLIIQQEFNDPKIGFVTVSRVQVSADLAHAKVFVSFLGKQERNEAGLRALNNAKGYVRSQCAKKMRLHKVPKISFILDDSLKKGERMENLFRKIEESLKGKEDNTNE